MTYLTFKDLYTALADLVDHVQVDVSVEATGTVATCGAMRCEDRDDKCPWFIANKLVKRLDPSSKIPQ